MLFKNVRFADLRPLVAVSNLPTLRVVAMSQVYLTILPFVSSSLSLH